MALDYNGRCFVIELDEAPPYSLERLGKLSLIVKTNLERGVAYLRSTPYFFKRGLEFVDGLVRTRSAEDRIEALEKMVEERERKVRETFKLKSRVLSEEELSPSLYGFKDSSISLFPSQVIGIELCAYMRRYALFFEQRCGKTLCMLGAYNRVCEQDGKDYRMLVMTGKSIMHVWEEHIDRFMSGVSRFRIYEKFKNKPYLVSNMGGRMIAITTHEFNSVKKLNLIKTFNPDIVVLDESQAFKNLSSQRSRNIFKAFREDTMRFCLSGTPTGQGYIDLYAQLKWLYEYDFPPSRAAFMNCYCHTYEQNMVRIISGYKNVGEIRRIVKDNSYRVRQEDNFDVPEKETTILNVTLDKETFAAYSKFKVSNQLQLDGKVLKTANALALLGKLRQFLSGAVITRHNDEKILHQVSGEKLEKLREYVDEHRPSADDKLIVYCVFMHEIDMIAELLEEMGVSFETISGSVPLRKRERIIKSFQEKDDPFVIIGQVKTLSAGIKLSRSRRVVFYTPDFSYQVIEQAKERIVDSSQKCAVKYIYLVVKNTLDEKIIRLLSKLKRQTDYMLDA